MRALLWAAAHRRWSPDAFEVTITSSGRGYKLTASRLERPTALVSALVDHLPVGVVVVDHRGCVVHVNAYERRMAGAHAADALGRSFFTEVAPCLEVRGLADAFRSGIHAESLSLETELSFRFAHLPKPRDVRMTVHSFCLESELLAVVCLQDITVFREHERVRDVLAATTIHDLRTPLTVAMLEIDATLHVLGADAPSHPGLLAARAGVDRAARLATTMLDVRRIVRGEMEPPRIDIDLVLLAAAALKGMRLLAEAQDVTLILAGDCAAPLRCDAALVRRALDNLLDNAIRNAPEMTEVTMIVTRTALGARAAVVDHGVGVPEQRRSVVFDMGETSGERSWNFGLGLTLVGLVAERHGGRAWVDETPGGGATFLLELQSSEAGTGI